MLLDIRFALRSLGQARGFTLAAVVTLALGISANTIVYAVVDALLLRPLPFGDRSGRLVTVHSTHPTQAQDWDDSDLSYPDAVDVRDSSRMLEGVEGLVERNVSLQAADATDRIAAASVTPGLFGLLGVAPQAGRGFLPEDGAEIGLESVALISDGVWQRRFAADPGIVGRTVMVNGRAVTVVGVMPAGFAFPEQHDIWLPYRPSRDSGRERRSLTAVALLRPGTSLSDARSELASIGAALAARHPATNRDWGLHAIPMRELFVGDATRRGVTAMLVAVGLVLLVGCANVASLLVARGMGRSRELMVRSALGAGRASIVRLLMVESLLLAIGGGLLGLLAAAWGLDALVASMPEPPPYWARIQLDARVLAFAFLVSLVTAIASGLAPAVRMSRVQLGSGYLQGGRSATAGPSHRRLQGMLVAAQVASSLALLVGATLLAKSTMALQRADIGFDAHPLLSARVYLAGDRYNDPVVRARAIEALTGRLAAMPGATAAAATGAIPGDDGGDGIRIVPPGGAPAGEEIGAQVVPITSAFFETLGLGLLEGRTFNSSEAEQPDGRAILIGSRLARQFWAGESAVGREIRVVTGTGAIAGLQVVGVVPDLVYEELGEETSQSRLIVYVPYVRAGWRTMAVLVRASGAPAALASRLRADVRGIDAGFAAYDVATMGDRRMMTNWGERFLGRTFAAFAVSALFLACFGVYGLTAHAAAERRKEIGIRMAIGASRADIVGLLLGRGARLAAAGGLAGIPLAFGASRLVEGLLFRVSPWDAQVWIALPVVLTAAVLIASFLPAHRASQVDPAHALRMD